MHGVSPIFVTTGEQDSAKYCATLDKGLIPFVFNTFCDVKSWIFQRDNAPIHTSRHTREYMSSKYIRTLPWPARTPDLNIIENVWDGWLERSTNVGITTRTFFL